MSIEIRVPSLGESITEVTLTRWFKHHGDVVHAGEPLFELSSDKVDTEVPAPTDGRLTQRLVDEGTAVEIGALVAVMSCATEEPAEDACALDRRPPDPIAIAAIEMTPPVTATSPCAAELELSPVVKRLIERHGVNPAELVGTGNGGRVTRDDVLRHIGVDVTSVPRSTPVLPAPRRPQLLSSSQTTGGLQPHIGLCDDDDRVVPLTRMRKIIGQRMIASQSISAHAFSVVDVNYSNVERTRVAAQADWRSAEGFSLNYLPFVIRSVVDALRRFPHLNASIGTDSLIVHRYVEIGVAIDLDYDGLVVGVVRAADEKRFLRIARDVNDLATRARDGKLEIADTQGGTFTISNNGSAGSVLSMPIISQPQVAILSTDAVRRRPAVVRYPDGNDGIAISPIGNLAMSWDHRAFDGAYAAGFLNEVRHILETRDWSTEI